MVMDHFGDDNLLNSDNSFEVNSKIMIVAVSVLFAVVLFILALHLYAKWFWRNGGSNSRVNNRTRRMLEFAADMHDENRMQFDVGLEKSVLDQLPTFIFNQQSASIHECAVCLEEFSEGEKGRLLPKCNHSFHTDCIDMWFLSHSTCPLCRCSVAPENSSSNIQQPLEAVSRGGNNNDGVGFRPSSGDIFLPYSHGDFSNDGVGFHPSSGDIFIPISHGGFSIANSSGDNDNGYSQDSRQGSSAGPGPLVAVVEHRSGRVSLWDSSTLGAGPGLLSPRQQQQQGSRPESPSSRRPSMSLSPKPSGIPYPANVLFWGNQTQMNVAGAVPVAAAREDNGGGRRRPSSRGVHALNGLVIEIPRSVPLESAGPAQHHIGVNIPSSNDQSHRASDALGGAARPRSPIGRLVSSSFRRLLSIRRGPTSPTPEGTCSTSDCEQQQQQDSTISSSSAGAATIQVSRS